MTIKIHSPFKNHHIQEEGVVFAPKFDDKGLISAVVTDAKTDVLLMVAHMNEEAVRLTLETGIAHYWSRSRNQIWKKGETSGNLQEVLEIRIDCDQDALWLKVLSKGIGAVCHTGRLSCFYRRVSIKDNEVLLIIDEDEPLFDPKSVYKV